MISICEILFHWVNLEIFNKEIAIMTVERKVTVNQKERENCF